MSYLSKKNKGKIAVTVLAKGFIQDLRDVIDKSSLNRLFIYLRHAVHIRQSKIFHRNIITKFNFPISYIYINYIISR